MCRFAPNAHLTILAVSPALCIPNCRSSNFSSARLMPLPAASALPFSAARSPYGFPQSALLIGNPSAVALITQATPWLPVERTPDHGTASKSATCPRRRLSRAACCWLPVPAWAQFPRVRKTGLSQCQRRSGGMLHRSQSCDQIHLDPVVTTGCIPLWCDRDKEWQSTLKGIFYGKISEFKLLEFDWCARGRHVLRSTYNAHVVWARRQLGCRFWQGCSSQLLYAHRLHTHDPGSLGGLIPAKFARQVKMEARRGEHDDLAGLAPCRK